MRNKIQLTSVDQERFLAVGLMSGTSADGIDAALCEIFKDDHALTVKLLHFETIEYDEDIKKNILAMCQPETSFIFNICRMNVVLGELMADAALKVVRNAGESMGNVDFISSHGQTVYHIPEAGATLQIGELAVIANKTGCLTVGDFRPNDLAAGGQGAPLVPFVDKMLFCHEKKGRLLVNIGGISNLTVLPAGADKSDTLVDAFDTGPGNVLIDEIMRIGTHGKSDYDKGGRTAAKGTVQTEWLENILEDDAYLSLPYPKSTGRERYTRQRAEELYSEGMKNGFSFEDIVATVTYYTVKAISSTVENQLDPKYVLDEVFVGGGGVHNDFLMKSLNSELSRPVRPMETLGFSSDAKEAVAFAILGARFMWGQPNNLPSATGANSEVIMGKLTFPS